MDVSVSLLENDLSFMNLLKLGLEDHFTISVTNDTRKFIDSVAAPAVLVIDIELDYGVNGIDVMKEIDKKHLDVHYIFMSAHKDADLLLRTVNEGLSCFFLIKTDPDFFQDLINKIYWAKKLIIRRADFASRAYEIAKNIENALKELQST